MINKIKDRINIYLDNKFKRLFKKQKAISQIQFNETLLKQLFADTSFYLPLTEWSMSPSTIVHVLNDIMVNDRKCIVEFGAGASTFYIAKLLKTNNLNTVFFTVESDTDWADKIKKQLDLLGLASFVTIINASIQPIDKALALGEQKTWYDVDILNEYLKTIFDVDLVLVDGPFGKLSANARFSAIPYLKSKLSINYSIFLDDIHRKEEQNILEAWSDILNCSTERIERYAILSSETKFDSKPFQLKNI
jgi:phospholipid N-methyltransferase